MIDADEEINGPEKIIKKHAAQKGNAYKAERFFCFNIHMAYLRFHCIYPM